MHLLISDKLSQKRIKIYEYVKNGSAPNEKGKLIVAMDKFFLRTTLINFTQLKRLFYNFLLKSDPQTFEKVSISSQLSKLEKDTYVAQLKINENYELPKNDHRHSFIDPNSLKEMLFVEDGNFFLIFEKIEHSFYKLKLHEKLIKMEFTLSKDVVRCVHINDKERNMSMKFESKQKAELQYSMIISHCRSLRYETIKILKGKRLSHLR